MTQTPDIEKLINTSFKDKSLLEQAFIHRSYLNEHKQQNLSSNERLEFLGDAALELATSQFLFKKFPQKPEGELTSLRSALVKTTTLAKIARKLKLGQFLKMSRGEKQAGGQDNVSLLANTVEAIIGAIYLDQGLKQVEKFTIRHLFPLLKQIIAQNLYRDYKSHLQELVQSQGQPTPTYHTLKEVGPDHQKNFTIEVRINHKALGKGTGPSKQKAEQNAAQQALAILEKK